MRRYTFLFLTLVLVFSFTNASAQNNSKTNKKTEKVADKSPLDKLHERAEKGDAEAMLLLGKAYYGGLEGAGQSYKTAASVALKLRRYGRVGHTDSRKTRRRRL